MSLLVKRILTALEFVIGDGFTTITTGQHGHLKVPFNCIIEEVELLARPLGAIKIDIWKDTYANFPPTDADSICGGNEPEITAGNQKYQDSILTGWTRLLAEGDILAYNVDSITTITKVTIYLKVNKL